MIKDYWNPTEEELQAVVDKCLPLDDKFGDRVFQLLRDNRKPFTSSSAILNMLYDIRDHLCYDCPSSFELMIEGYESGVKSSDYW
jgi:hypothetical protein